MQTEIREYLGRYLRACTKIKYTKSRIENLREEMQSIKSMQITDMPRGGEHKTMDDLLDYILEYEKSLNEQTKEALKIKYEIEKAISELEPGIEQDILICKYINGMNLRQMMYELDRSKSNIYSHLTSAIKKIRFEENND